MATPAAILTVLVRAQGAGAAAAELNAVNAAGTKAAAGGLAKSEKAAMGAGAAYKSAAKHVAAFVGAYVGFKAVEKSVETTDSLAKTTLSLAKNYGLATRRASEWAAVATARGVDGKQLGVGFKTLSKQVQGAATGSKAAVATFKQLGITQDDLKKHGNDLGYVLNQVSDGLGRLPGGTRKAAIQGTLFGRTWQGISPIIRNGSKAMDEQLKVADKYGASFGGKTLHSIEEMVKAQREAKLASIGLQVTLGTTVIPVLTKVIGAVAQFVEHFREGTGAAGQLRGAIDQVVKALQPLAQSVQTIVGWLSKQGEAGKVIIGVLAGVAAGIWAVNAAMSANPATLFVAALAAVAIALVTAYRESATFRDILNTVAAVAVTVGQAVARAFADALPTLKTIGQTALGVGKAVVGAFVAVGGALANAGSAVVHEVSQWGPLFHFLGNIVTAVVGVVKVQLAVLVALVKVTTALLGPAFAAAWSIVKSVTSAAWSYITGVVRGGLLALRGIIKIIGGLFKGDFSQIWDGIKDVFRGGLTVLRGILAGAWKILKAPVDALSAGLHDAFSNTWGRIKDVFKSGVSAITTFVNAIIDVINALPFIPDIHHVGGGGGRAPNTTQHAPATGGAQGRFKEGGLVTMPVAIMGEEAPKHPEWVIPTNPAYRNRAVGLWAKAAHDLGVPGFAKGGVLGAAAGAASDLIGKLPGVGHLPGFLKDMGSGILKEAVKWIKKKAAAPVNAVKDLFTGNAIIQGLLPRVIRAVAFAKQHGWHGVVTSGFRTLAQQTALWNGAPGNGLVRGITVARPGTSSHEKGEAVDVSLYQQFLHAMGLAPPDSKLLWRGPSDPVHFSISGHRKGGLLAFRYGGKFIAGLARGAGFKGDAIDMATAIALAESRGDPKAVSKTGDYGLWQINRAAHPGYFKIPGKIFSPSYNADAAYAISDHGKNWNPWTTYRTGAYKAYLGASGGKGGSVLRKGKPGLTKGKGHGSTGIGGGGGGNLPSYTDKGPSPDVYDAFYTAAQTIAAGTPGLGDDQRALGAYLQYAQSGLKGSIASGNAQGINDFSQKVATITQSLHDLPLNDMQKAFDALDLHVRAGDITGAQAKQQKIDALTQAINTGTYNGATLDPDQILELRADLEDLKGTIDAQTQAAQDLANATMAQNQLLSELKTSIQEQNDFATSVAGVTSTAAIKALADVINGQIGGRSYTGRSQTASAGTTVRF